jgi:hypothetical protein
MDQPLQLLMSFASLLEIDHDCSRSYRVVQLASAWPAYRLFPKPLLASPLVDTLPPSVALPLPRGEGETVLGDDFQTLYPGVPYGDQSALLTAVGPVTVGGRSCLGISSTHHHQCSGPENLTCAFIVRSVRGRARVFAGVL